MNISKDFKQCLTSSGREDITFDLINRKEVKITFFNNDNGEEYSFTEDINKVFTLITFNLWVEYLEWITFLNNKDLIDID